MKISIIGSPGSGKTVLAALLYAELLELGLYHSRLISEYAHEYLGEGHTIDSLQDQNRITEMQTLREINAVRCGFSPIICDSPIWLGAVYADYRIATQGKSEKDFEMNDFQDNLDIYRAKLMSKKSDYSVNIFVPLFSDDNMVSEFRITDNKQSLEIESIMRSHLSDLKNVYYASKNLKNRRAFVKYVAGEIVEMMDHLNDIKTNRKH